MKATRSKLAAIAGVAIAGLTLSACFTANLSGNGKTGSVLQPDRLMELEIRTTDSLGTGLGSLSGKFKDTGSNAAFPYGVSLSFKKGTTYGFGFNCSETTTTSSSSTSLPPPGPQRRVHTRPAGTIGIEGLCSAPGSENARVWFGLVTYSSADRRVPNVSAPECAEAYYYYLHYGYTTAPTKAQLASVKTRAMKDPASRAITGFGELVIVDANNNGRNDSGDGFGFATVCGPYANLDGTALPPFGPVGQNCAPNALCPGDNYSYATCSDGAFGYGGVYPTELAYIGGPLAVAEMLSTECGDNLTSGNLKIGIATDYTSGPTGPTGP